MFPLLLVLYRIVMIIRPLLWVWVTVTILLSSHLLEDKTCNVPPSRTSFRCAHMTYQRQHDLIRFLEELTSVSHFSILSQHVIVCTAVEAARGLDIVYDRQDGDAETRDCLLLANTNPNPNSHRQRILPVCLRHYKRDSLPSF
jgi:hypothetical protein